ncbi:sodium:proton antiporter [Tumebacillus sp. ITR2]|uniref:Nickel/cobalt efflux system n=1 Tax=Tumebacillus amylolyticus TaxID=2801339 RepID=A0ABS1J7M4_9BACL|nr:sodium:proton antiporter [Tumebacillus amylolyticus]MBL0385663.1 sodium:proton antiporter [Tumebacillus amylolyticus]
MDAFSWLALVFVLGLRHGLDADHLAFIDGLARHNLHLGRRITPWVGTLFSFGHGLVVATVAVILAEISRDFTYPDYFDIIGTWVSIGSLALVGGLNLVNLLRNSSEQTDFAPQGIKGRFLPRAARETTNPFLIILTGGVFALAADTVTQTSVWALAAGHADQRFLPLLLGLAFMVGMMLTDTVDSLVAYRLLAKSGRFGRTASKAMGWLIVVLAFGVSFYESFTWFHPGAEIDFEVVGVVLFALLALSFGGVRWILRKKTVLP